MATIGAAGGIITPDRRVERGAIEVRDGAVSAVVALADDVDAPDGVLLPGFVDLQCNGAAGLTLRAADARSFDGVARALLVAGVTAWCPTLPTARPDDYPRFLDAVAAASRRPGPRVIGAHLEGPFLNPRRKGAHDESLLRAPDSSWLAGVLDGWPGIVSIVTLAPELPGAGALIDICVERGVVVSLGHTDATAAEAREAFARGATMVTHLFNAMRPIHHRDPGVVVEAVDNPSVRCGLIADGVHVDSAAAGIFARMLGPRRCCVVSDAVASPSPGPVLSGGFTLLDGALRNLLAWGFPLHEAARMLTRTPAEAVGRTDMGSLEPGAFADAVLWRDGAIEQVWIGGEAQMERPP